MPHHPARHPHDSIAGVDPLSIEVFHALKRLMHLQRQVTTRMLSDGPMSFSTVACLRALAEHDGITQRDLAERMHVARPTITTMLTGLEADGLIERRPDADDRRLTRVALTEKGRTAHAQAKELFAVQIDSTIGRMPEADRRELLRLLGDLGDRTAELMDSYKEGTA